jgi:GNAT superfamily N-acetyltransferase
MSAAASPDPLVRRATAEDAAELARLRWEHCFELYVHPTDPAAGLDADAFREAFERFLVGALGGGRWAVWVAEAGGRVVGTVSVETVTMVPTPWKVERRWGYVTSVQVDPAFRAGGIGRMMMDAAAAWARDTGLRLLRLWPSDNSVAFYESMGYIASPEAMELDLGE